MSIPNDGKMLRRPTHPGVLLREDFMPEHNLTVAALAQILGVSRQTVNEILRERRSLSADMAVRLGRLFGTTPQLWLNLQTAVDLWDAERALKAELKKIKPLTDTTIES